MVRLANEWRLAVARGQDVAVLTDAALRRPVRQAIARALPDLAVIAYQEVPADLLLEPAAMVKPEDLGIVVAGSAPILGSPAPLMVGKP